MTTLPLTEHKRKVGIAWFNGKTVQELKDTWHDCRSDVPPSLIGDDSCWRIKPGPKRRFWRPEEIPVGWQARKCDGVHSYTIVSFTMEAHGVTCHLIGSFVNITEANYDQFAVAPPGPANEVTWIPAGVEE